MLVNAVGAQVSIAGDALGDDAATVAGDDGALDEWVVGRLLLVVDDGGRQVLVEGLEGARVAVEQQLDDGGVGEESRHAPGRQPRVFPARRARHLVRVVLGLLEAGLTIDVKTLV